MQVEVIDDQTVKFVLPSPEFCVEELNAVPLGLRSDGACVFPALKCRAGNCRSSGTLQVIVEVTVAVLPELNADVPPKLDRRSSRGECRPAGTTER
jgi:hypothetical protein